MKGVLLRVDGLRVSVGGKLVLHGVDLVVRQGEVHALMGANGSGKSSLANTLLGNPEYKVESGRLEFEGRDLVGVSVEERAKRGLFVAWQNPIVIPGVSVFSLGKASYEALRQSQSKPLEYKSLVDFKKKLEELAVRVGLSKEHVSRNVNEGFSGGEKKRLELLQLMLLKPKLAILDEIDSGLDGEGVRILVGLIREMKQAGTSVVIITHSKNLVEEMKVDKVWKTIN